MNIVKDRQKERLERISVIQRSIKKSKNPDIEKLLMLAMSDWGISERTAKEYVKIAIFNVENKK